MEWLVCGSGMVIWLMTPILLQDCGRASIRVTVVGLQCVGTVARPLYVYVALSGDDQLTLEEKLR